MQPPVAIKRVPARGRGSLCAPAADASPFDDSIDAIGGVERAAKR